MDREEAIAKIAQIPDTAVRIMWMMYLKGTPVTQPWLAKQMNKDRATIRRYLRYLVRHEYVEQTTWRTWQLSDDSLFTE